MFGATYNKCHGDQGYNADADFEGSGCVDETKFYSTMDRVRGPIEKIYYGQNNRSVFLAFEGEVLSLDISDLKLYITIEESGKKLEFDMDRRYSDDNFSLAIGERVEISLDRSYFKDYKRVHLRFEIVRGDNTIQEMPGFGSLLIDLDETYVHNWFI